MAADDFHQSVCSTVARALYQERQRQGISLNSLAQRAGVSRQTVRFIETEERSPTLLTLLRIASVLDINLGDIVAEAIRKRARGAKKTP